MIIDARNGFRIALGMDIVLFTLGILMLGAAAGMAIASGSTNTSWISVGATGGSGALIMMYSMFIAQPRKQVKVVSCPALLLSPDKGHVRSNSSCRNLHFTGCNRSHDVHQDHFPWISSKFESARPG